MNLQVPLSQISIAFLLLAVDALGAVPREGQPTELAAPRYAESEPARDEYRPPERYLSGRASLGIGGGSVGFGGRVGLAGEYWFTDALAIGLAAAGMGQTSGVFAGPESSAWVVAPVVGLRSDATAATFFGTLGAGYAVVTLTDVQPSFLGGAGTQRLANYQGYDVTAALGWLHHGSGSGRRGVGFEIGLPVMRFDAVGGFHADEPGAYLITVNLELGLAAWRPR